MRPFIHVNCAMSADGKIAGEERSQVRISSASGSDSAIRLTSSNVGTVNRWLSGGRAR